MVSIPKTPIVSCGALIFGLTLAGCLSRPVTPRTWYDFETSWLNTDVGGVTPWTKRDHESIDRAAKARQGRWARAEAAEYRRLAGITDDAAPRHRGNKRPSTRRRAKKDKIAKRARRRAAPVEKTSPKERDPRRPLPARIAKGAQPPRHQEPEQRKGGPILGDGSVSGELLAGARRLLGITNSFGAGGFLKHLLTIAAVNIRVTAPADRFAQSIWRALDTKGRTSSKTDRPSPGDLAFFSGADPSDKSTLKVAVVEEIDEAGIITCIGEVHGVVSRFVMDPGRPWVRRDESAGADVNTPIRPRSLDDDPKAPTLAGALLVGYARP